MEHTETGSFVVSNGLVGKLVERQNFSAPDGSEVNLGVVRLLKRLNNGGVICSTEKTTINIDDIQVYLPLIEDLGCVLNSSDKPELFLGTQVLISKDSGRKVAFISCLKNAFSDDKEYQDHIISLKKIGSDTEKTWSDYEEYEIREAAFYYCPNKDYEDESLEALYEHLKLVSGMKVQISSGGI